MTVDPTTASIEAQNNEREELRAENLHFRHELMAACTEVETAKAARADASFVAGYDQAVFDYAKPMIADAQGSALDADAQVDAGAAGALADDEVLASPRGLPTFKAAKRAAISAFERQYLAHVLVLADGSITIASKITGVDRANLRRLLIRNGLRPPGEKTVKKQRAKARGRESRRRAPEVRARVRASAEKESA